MKRKVSFVLSGILATAAILTACGGGQPAAQPAPTGGSGGSSGSSGASQPTDNKPAEPKKGEKIVIKVAHTVPDDSSVQKGSLKFKELVEKNSNGQMEVQVFSNSQLANEKDMIEGNKLGTIQIGIPSAAMLSTFAPKAGVLALPYVLKGTNERERYASLVKLSKSDAYKEIATQAEEAGLKVIPEAVWWYGDRNITTKGKDIVKPEDVKGLKIRTPDAQAHTEPFKAMGANVTPMAFTEVYMALKTGTIDAQENPINTIYTAKFYEVQDRVNMTGHMTQNQIPTISLKWWKTLTADQQKIISDALIESGKLESDLQLKANEDQLKDLEAKGMKIVKSDQAAFKEATKDVYKVFESKYGAGYYEKILKAQE